MMDITEISGFNVTGLMVRTSNNEEMDAATAKIGTLWERFYKLCADHLDNNAKVYGLYTNYESDAGGAFDVVACSDALSEEQFEHSVGCHIATGKYLRFLAKGDMPQAVIGAWGEVWAYFSASHCAHERLYSTDFEFYKSANEVEIFIAIK